MQLYDRQAADPIRLQYKTTAKELIPLPADILVVDMYFGMHTTASGLILPDDNGKERGIHPRWARVYAVGEKQQCHVKPGQWVFVAHGRWSRAVEVQIEGEENTVIVRKVDPKDILLICDEQPDIKLFY